MRMHVQPLEGDNERERRPPPPPLKEAEGGGDVFNSGTAEADRPRRWRTPRQYADGER